MGMITDFEQQRVQIRMNYRRTRRKLYEELGRRLKLWRKDHRLSQVKLAEMLGISQPAVSKWERGSDPIDFDRLGRLCPEILEALENEA